MEFLKSRQFLILLFLVLCGIAYTGQGSDALKVCLIAGIFGFTLSQLLR